MRDLCRFMEKIELDFQLAFESTQSSNTNTTTMTDNTIQSIKMTAPKGTKIRFTSATKIGEEGIATEGIPEWAKTAMKEGKQVIQRDGEWYMAEYENEEEEKRFGISIQELIKGDHHDESDVGSIHHEHKGGATEFFYHLANGKTITNLAELPQFSARMRANLREATQVAISNRNWNLSWRSEDQSGEEAGLTKQMRNYIDDAFDYDFYEAMSATLKKGWRDEDGVVNQKEVIFFLVGEWLKEQSQKKHIDFGKYGGDWNCGEHSGVWADFLLTVKSNPDFKGHQPHKGEFYIGVRLHATSVIKTAIGTLLNPFRTEGWRPTFTIVSTTLLYEPQDFGLTTVMMPNYGKPFRPTAVKTREMEMKEEARAEKAREKALAHQAFCEEQRRIQAELKKKREEDEMERVLAETIKAYNEKATKDIIAFNRTHIAEPLRKRIEAKEREREAEEAERRHAEKMKQKEMERLAKHAPSFKTTRKA